MKGGKAMQSDLDQDDLTYDERVHYAQEVMENGFLPFVLKTNAKEAQVGDLDDEPYVGQGEVTAAFLNEHQLYNVEGFVQDVVDGSFRSVLLDESPNHGDLRDVET